MNKKPLINCSLIDHCTLVHAQKSNPLKIIADNFVASLTWCFVTYNSQIHSIHSAMPNKQLRN